MAAHLITLQNIRDAGPCASGWKKLLTGLGENPSSFKTTREISIGDILALNGLEDALWALRCIQIPRARLQGVCAAMRRSRSHFNHPLVVRFLEDFEAWMEESSNVPSLKRRAHAAAELIATTPDTFDWPLWRASGKMIQAAIVASDWTSSNGAGGAGSAAQCALLVADMAAYAVTTLSPNAFELASVYRRLERQRQSSDLMMVFGQTDASLSRG